MRIPETAEFAVENERNSIRWFYIHAGALIVIGVGVLVVIFAFPITPTAEPLKPVIAIAATFIGSMGGFPLKEIIAREQRVRYLRWLKQEAQQPNADLPQLESLLLDFVKKGGA